MNPYTLCSGFAFNHASASDWNYVMRMEPFMADTLLRAAVTAVQQGGDQLHEALDTLPVPVYLTDAEGVITYYNHVTITPAFGLLGALRVYARIAGVSPGSSTPSQDNFFPTISVPWRWRYRKGVP